MQEISFDKFYEDYQLKRNPIELLSPYDNTMLDFGDNELDYIEAEPTYNVWTLIEDNTRRKFVLYPGIHYKHVVGYFVSGRPWINENEKYVLI